MNIAQYLDHSVLKPVSTQNDIIEACNIANEYKVASLCIRPCDVATAANYLLKSIPLCTVIGFPHGTNTTQTKIYETEKAIAEGCSEIDMVVNLGFVKSKLWKEVQNEIELINNLCKNNKAKLKVIFENCYLNGDEKLRLIEICNSVGPDWIKTSTGFGTAGATIEDVSLMIKNKIDKIQVKASGGIRDKQTALQFIELGCTRIGTSATIEILK